MDIVTTMNNASDGLIGLGMLTLVFFVIMYRNYMAEGKVWESLGSALYITLLSGALFWWMSLIPFSWMLILIVVTSLYVGIKTIVA